MKSRKEIEAQIVNEAERLKSQHGHLASITRGYLEALEWVLEDSGKESASIKRVRSVTKL